MYFASLHTEMIIDVNSPKVAIESVIDSVARDAVPARADIAAIRARQITVYASVMTVMSPAGNYTHGWVLATLVLTAMVGIVFARHQGVQLVLCRHLR